MFTGQPPGADASTRPLPALGGQCESLSPVIPGNAPPGKRVWGRLVGNGETHTQSPAKSLWRERDNASVSMATR